jgi:hypothetical protein
MIVAGSHADSVPRRVMVLVTSASALVATLCALVVLRAPAPAYNSDSMSYLGAARSEVARHGWEIPVGWRGSDTTTILSHYPPGYSAALAIPLRLGADADNAVRVVNGVSLIVATTLLAAVMAVSCGPLAALLAVTIVLATPSIEMAAATAMSDTLFAVPLMSVLLLMLVFPERPLLYGGAAAACVLVRYAGMSMCVAAAFWASRQAYLRRSTQLTHVLAAALPGVAVFATWAVHARSGGDTVRRVGVDLDIHSDLATGVRTVVRWLAPPVLGSTAVRAAIALGIVCLLAFALRPALRREASRRLIVAVTVMGVSYAVTVVAARILADRAIRFDDRLWTPCVWLVAAAVAVTVSVAMSVAPATRVARWVVVAGVCTIWLIPSIVSDVAFRDRLRSIGWDMSSTALRDSPTLAWVRGPGRRYPIFSNNAPAVYLHTGRSSRGTPYDFDTAAALAMGRALEARCGALVALRAGWFHGMPGDALARLLGLSAVGDFADGSVWRSPRCAARPDADAGS